MGLGASQQTKETFELPALKYKATLYYFSGRGVADQIRWMLAACEISFTQKSINTREKFLKMSERQLPFGQLPLLQIDDLEIVQSQAAIRYLAKRNNLIGASIQEELKCDVIAETIKDFIPFLTKLPFVRARGDADELAQHLAALKERWAFIGGRFEGIIANNENTAFLVGECLLACFCFWAVWVVCLFDCPIFDLQVYFVSAKLVCHVLTMFVCLLFFQTGNQYTYADILMAHLVTWVCEEVRFWRCMLVVFALKILFGCDVI